MASESFLARHQPALNQKDTRTRLKGCFAVVTGGASGIGRATVERLLNDGVERLAILDLNQSAGEATRRDLIENEGVDSGRLIFYPCDVSDREAVEQTVSSFAREHCGGSIHFLVNSAVYFGSVGLNGTSEQFLTSYRVNVIGCVNATRAVHPYMRSVHDAAIVNVSSISAHRSQPQRWSYAATKGAVDILTKDMALDLAVDKIRVNAVTPGFIWSPEQAKAGSREQFRPLTEQCSFAGRDGETSEVAAAIAFLLSKDAAFVNGADLKVDGGYSAMGPEGKGEASTYAGHDE